MGRSAIPRTVLTLLLVCPMEGAGQWLTVGGDFRHSGLAESGPADFSRLRWLSGVPDEYPLQGSGPAVWGNRVVVLGEIFDGVIPVFESVIAYDRATGTRLWETPIDYPVYVNNHPTIDVAREAVLVAAHQTLYSIALPDGSVNWVTPIDRTTNASFAVLGDLGYITDYDGFGTWASLYAVNLEPNDPNYDAGEIVWQSPIGGASGATPAIGNGRVYVGSTEGRIHAFDPSTGDPIWTTDMPALGWECGWSMETVTYHNDFIYAASYNYYGGEYSSHLVKLDADTGAWKWDVPCERTFSTPVVLEDHIYLTGGIAGGAFGSVPKLMCFRDLGNSAILEWDTTLVGGTTFHPVYADGKLYAGRARPFPEDFVYEELFIFDVTRTPGAPDFVLDHFTGAGASPALVDGTLYTIGVDGLYAFDSPRPGDIDEDGDVDLGDFVIFAACFGGCDAENPPPGCSTMEFERCDLDSNGCVNLADFVIFVQNFGR